MVFLPLADRAPMRRLRAPHVTRALVAAHVGVFVLFQSGWALSWDPEFAMAFGLIPSVLFGQAHLEGFAHAPTLATLFTYTFLHGGWAHLFFNMLYLWTFADNVEDAMGHGRFIVFYLAAGALAGYAFALSAPEADSPLIGASGAVSAVIVAYLLLYPRARVFGLAFNIIPIEIGARWALGSWIVVQIGHALFDVDRSIAWSAHLGGAVAGAALVVALKAPETPLFGPHEP